MQSTGQTSIQASQPVQLSARTTANCLGSFLRAFPAPLAMSGYLFADERAIFGSWRLIVMITVFRPEFYRLRCLERRAGVFLSISPSLPWARFFGPFIQNPAAVRNTAVCWPGRRGVFA